jgi:hypothetical protein
MADRRQTMNRLASEQTRATACRLVVAISLAAHNSSALAEPGPCRAMEYERSAYTVCEVDLRQQTIRLYWKRSDGTAYAYLSALPRALEGEGGKLLFATNAGMFDPALKPVGLYVQQGREFVRVNTTSGYGNFHMKPNGVFYPASSAMERVFGSSSLLTLLPRLGPFAPRRITRCVTRSRAGHVNYSTGTKTGALIFTRRPRCNVRGAGRLDRFATCEHRKSSCASGDSLESRGP